MDITTIIEKRFRLLNVILALIVVPYIHAVPMADPKVFTMDGTVGALSYMVVSTAIDFVILTIGIVMMFAAFAAERRGFRSVRIMDVGVFLFLCGVWFLTDSAFAGMFVDHAGIICSLSFIVFMMMSVPVIHLVCETERRKLKLLMGCGVAFYVNLIVQMIVTAIGIADFRTMLPMTHILMTVSIAGVLMALWENRQSRLGRGNYRVLGGMILLLLCAGVALVSYWVFRIEWYIELVKIGLIVFAFIEFEGVMEDVEDAFKSKSEAAAFKRLLVIDKMTGLGNRKAFDEALETLDVKRIGNALLIFVYLERLKDTNNRYGRHVGDEMVYGLGRTLRKMFERVGGVYRVAGDEFAVILIDPKDGKDVWLGKLAREIDIYNRESRTVVRIAAGGSMLRGENGEIKSISSWKTEADREMHKNKRSVEKRG